MCRVRYGVTANITAFHAVARGSIPRIGVLGVEYAHFPRQTLAATGLCFTMHLIQKDIAKEPDV